MRSIFDILHKNFQEDQLNSRRFPGGFLNSSRFPGFVDTLPWDGKWAVYRTDYLVGTKSFVLSCKNAQAKDDLRLTIRGRTGRLS